MKKYRFTITASNVERMWDFAQLNQVNFHFVRSAKILDNHPTNMFKEDIYTYEGFMDRGTYVAFCLTVPLKPTNG